MTPEEKKRLIDTIKTAVCSIGEITALYAGLLKKSIEDEKAGSDQAMMLSGNIVALNHAAGAMERLCRILEKYEPGKEVD